VPCPIDLHYQQLAAWQTEFRIGQSWPAVAVAAFPLAAGSAAFLWIAVVESSPQLSLSTTRIGALQQLAQRTSVIFGHT